MNPEPERLALPEAAADAVLRDRFGIAALRDWQGEAIRALLEVSSRVLVVAPTGGGKSLTYQLPAVLLPGTALVLSPLVALMEDQVRALTERGIPATYLAATLEVSARREREERFLRGDYKLVYAAPERLASENFVSLLGRTPLSLVAVDEAHCIAHWGHDFRPDYLRIGELLQRLRPRRVLACTATATPEVRREIREHLGFGTGSVEILRGFARPNLHLSAQHTEGPREVRDLVTRSLERALGSARSPSGGAIVYGATRKNTELLALTLRERGWRVDHYHAGESSEHRTRVAQRFANGSLSVVCATNAFGMGIDRSDIRVVVHAQPPASIEAYYQEVGRAGRDGGEAHGLLLCSTSDIALRRRLCETASDGGAAEAGQAARAWAQFRELLRYLDACTCRHDFVLRYFGDEQEILGGCGHCDICEELGANESTLPQASEVAIVVRKALSGVARADRRAGLSAIAEMLRGVGNDRVKRFGFDRLSTFGVLEGHEPEWMAALLRGLLTAGWIDLTASEHPVPFLTRAGAAVMRGTAPIRFTLPRAERARSETRRRTPSARPRGAAPESLSEEARPLFERLRAGRAAIARDEKVPPYVVAHDRTLLELASRRPRTKAELAQIHGFGPLRIERYGPRFLSILAESAKSADS